MLHLLVDSAYDCHHIKKLAGDHLPYKIFL